jgi:3-methyl-2-oxobutanoate hydroxymethyltransferase
MRVSINDIQTMKRRGERFAMLTAYDFGTARVLDEAGIPLLLVGDSLGMVVLGHETTIPVTLDDILHHTRAVVRGSQRALIVADLPFLTYQVSPAEALRNAGRLMQEGGAQAVKLEGGVAVAETVAQIVAAGIPVMGHIGLTPQAVYQLGGFRVQGKSLDAVQQLLEDARALEAAGVFALVVECVPAEVGRLITEAIEVPTIGIGAGPDCDAQVQVISDMLHLLPGPVPKHAKPYVDVSRLVGEAVARFREDVEAGRFPTEEQCFALPRGLDVSRFSKSGRA